MSCSAGHGVAGERRRPVLPLSLTLSAAGVWPPPPFLTAIAGHLSRCRSIIEFVGARKTSRHRVETGAAGCGCVWLCGGVCGCRGAAGLARGSGVRIGVTRQWRHHAHGEPSASAASASGNTTWTAAAIGAVTVRRRQRRRRGRGRQWDMKSVCKRREIQSREKAWQQPLPQFTTHMSNASISMVLGYRERKT
ncbi:hypothetical protein AAHA92_33833 [Salvia divinorum]|uniref:Uncharacterized protein n=1 Tax=Salvia divinorum TaxID=28513 RepID=A0ABD1FH25_SALDI